MDEELGPLSVPAEDEAPVLNPIEEEEGWAVCDWAADLPDAETRLRFAIPARFTEMMAGAPDVAMNWRLTTRRLFQTLFVRRYRVVDFARAAGGGGTYLLEQEVE
jgi:predicted GNAT superfamily acetyltransferase